MMLLAPLVLVVGVEDAAATVPVGVPAGTVPAEAPFAPAGLAAVPVNKVLTSGGMLRGWPSGREALWSAPVFNA